MKAERVWVAALIAGLAATEIASHAALKTAMPPELAHTGFRIGDTPYFLTAMQAFVTGFDSPYAVSDAPMGSANPGYYALPHHWLYAALGWIARGVGLDAFIALGLANSLGAALYLLAAHRFFRWAYPARATLAFTLFALGGGLAGWLYWIAYGAGWTGLDGFDLYFHRYARYELIEGPFIAPLLAAPRLYYTVPLALGFFGFTRWARGVEQGGRADPLALMLLFACALLNARVGVLLIGAMACWRLCRADAPAARRWLQLLAPAAAVGAAAGAALGAFNAFNPAGAENVHELLRRPAWFASVLSATLWHAALVGPALVALWRGLPPLARAVAGAGCGYLACYAALYLAHQAYYGNLGFGGDTAAAVKVSDPALIGAAIGAATGWRLGPRAAVTAPLAWAVLWFLGGLAIAVSAFGQGRLLPMMPERFLVTLGPPLALLAAHGYARLAGQAPRLARAFVALILASGAMSAAAGLLAFQGPWAWDHASGAFRWTHSEAMHPDDAALIARMPAGGVVLAPIDAPPYFGDVLVYRLPGTRAVLGQPSLEFSGVNMLARIREVQHFFDPEAPEAFRRECVARWGVDRIYAPAARPIPPAARAALEATPWIELAGEEGGAAWFRVLEASADGA